jgi:hypothetical protein
MRIQLNDSDVSDIQEALNGRVHSALELADTKELAGEDNSASLLRQRAARLLKLQAKITEAE